MQLLTRYVPEIVQYESDIARTLVRAVGGHPLALTLMSKYLGSNAAMGQPRRLRAALNHLLDAEQRLRLYMPQLAPEYSSLSSSETDVSISSVIAISYLHLPEMARQALLSLSVLPVKPTRLTRNAILAVTNVTLDVLDMLCDAELLERYRDVYYMLHPLIADYIHAQGPAPEASARLIKYGVNFIETHSTDASALEHESSMLLAALDCAWKSEQWDELLLGSILFVPFLFRWGWYTLAEQLLQRASIAAIQNGNLYYKILSSGTFEYACSFARKLSSSAEPGSSGLATGSSGRGLGEDYCLAGTSGWKYTRIGQLCIGRELLPGGAGASSSAW